MNNSAKCDQTTISVQSYNTYLKRSQEIKKSRNREANLGQNGWEKIAQYDLEENENAKKSAIDTIQQHIGFHNYNYTTGVYWIRYDFWGIRHIFIYAK